MILANSVHLHGPLPMKLMPTIRTLPLLAATAAAAALFAAGCKTGEPR
jgi:hypothetical protein